MIRELTESLNKEIDKLDDLKQYEKKYNTELENSAYLEGYIMGLKHAAIKHNILTIQNQLDILHFAKKL